jgi:hypothetical protein
MDRPFEIPENYEAGPALEPGRIGVGWITQRTVMKALKL